MPVRIPRTSCEQKRPWKAAAEAYSTRGILKRNYLIKSPSRLIHNAPHLQLRLLPPVPRFAIRGSGNQFECRFFVELAVCGPSSQAVMTQIPGINRMVNCGRQNQGLGMGMNQGGRGVSMAPILCSLRADLSLL
jgi:hypothetical protein